MNKLFIAVLRTAIAAAFLAGLFAQISMVVHTPLTRLFDFWPPLAPSVLSVPVTILGIACVQTVLAASWMLVGMIERDVLFNDRAFRWLKLIVAATLAATLLAAGTAAFLMFRGMTSSHDYAMTLILTFSTVVAWVGAGAGAVFATIMVILRGLLRKATDLKAEMAEVV
ncbi:DUF2975 domain-containing protein [Glycomyces harbinensis]|uniref:DUF2975 domain-containing protein n=1 Tax=Glycomyces harbinensis TaxID=58114 RepID=A0A1G6XG42_9ACTN|nr:DUF2975 domain-containing protein [Glycomyces harbinensis]SDD76166.1 Protein of unknown function [Glycomyces harbinensis]